MSLKKLIFPSLLSLFSIGGYATPYCTADQVSIHELALSAGGMMQTRSLFRLAMAPILHDFLAQGNQYLASAFLAEINKTLEGPITQANFSCHYNMGL